MTDWLCAQALEAIRKKYGTTEGVVILKIEHLGGTRYRATYTTPIVAKPSDDTVIIK